MTVLRSRFRSRVGQSPPGACEHCAAPMLEPAKDGKGFVVRTGSHAVWLVDGLPLVKCASCGNKTKIPTIPALDTPQQPPVA